MRRKSIQQQVDWVFCCSDPGRARTSLPGRLPFSRLSSLPTPFRLLWSQLELFCHLVILSHYKQELHLLYFWFPSEIGFQFEALQRGMTLRNRAQLACGCSSRLFLLCRVPAFLSLTLLAWSAQFSRRLFSSWADKCLRIWRPKTLKLLRLRGGHQPVKFLGIPWSICPWPTQQGKR